MPSKQYHWHLVNLGYDPTRHKTLIKKMPVQPLLDRHRHRHRHPSNGRDIATFWTASTATAATMDTTTATHPMEEALATATTTHPMEEPSPKMKK
jgi:hypothetical protein